jgi:hypothetical protein
MTRAQFACGWGVQVFGVAGPLDDSPHIPWMTLLTSHYYLCRGDIHRYRAGVAVCLLTARRMGAKLCTVDIEPYRLVDLLAKIRLGVDDIDSSQTRGRSEVWDINRSDWYMPYTLDIPVGSCPKQPFPIFKERETNQTLNLMCIILIRGGIPRGK